MAENEIKFDDEVDITDVVCPVTFVKVKVALEELDAGQILRVRMNDGEPVQNVPRSVKDEGHQILKLMKKFHLLGVLFNQLCYRFFNRLRI